MASELLNTIIDAEEAAASRLAAAKLQGEEIISAAKLRSEELLEKSAAQANSRAANIIDEARQKSNKIIEDKIKQAEIEAVALGANCAGRVDLTLEAIKASFIN